MSHTLKTAFAALLALLPATSALAVDQHVGSGQTFATIQAAIDAAGAGDNIIVHTGTYNEKITWNKAVNIIENTGDTAVLQLSSPLNGFAVDWQANGTVTWDGVDMVIDNTGFNRGFLFRGAAGTNMTVQNMSITDTANASAGGLRIVGPENGTITFINVTFECDNAEAEGVVIYGPGTAGSTTLTDCTLRGNSQKILFAEVPTVAVTLNNCTVTKTSAGGPIGGFITDWFSGTLTLNDSTVTIPAGVARGILTRIGSGTCVVNINRSVIDARLDSWPIVPENSATINMTNSVIIKDPAAGGVQFGAIAAGGSPTFNFTHCTMSSTAAHSGNTLLNIESSGLTTVNVNNCIIDIPGSNVGAVRHNGSGTETVTAGTNLVNAVGGSNAAGVLTGTILSGDPELDADFIHLGTANTPAISTAANIGVTDDIDGETRPLGTGLDFGADETALVPVEASAFSVD